MASTKVTLRIQELPILLLPVIFQYTHAVDFYNYVKSIHNEMKSTPMYYYIIKQCIRFALEQQLTYKIPYIRETYEEFSKEVLFTPNCSFIGFLEDNHLCVSGLAILYAAFGIAPQNYTHLRSSHPDNVFHSDMGMYSELYLYSMNHDNSNKNYKKGVSVCIEHPIYSTYNKTKEIKQCACPVFGDKSTICHYRDPSQVIYESPCVCVLLKAEFCSSVVCKNMILVCTVHEVNVRIKPDVLRLCTISEMCYESKPYKTKYYPTLKKPFPITILDNSAFINYKERMFEVHSATDFDFLDLDIKTVMAIPCGVLTHDNPQGTHRPRWNITNDGVICEPLFQTKLMKECIIINKLKTVFQYKNIIAMGCERFRIDAVKFTSYFNEFKPYYEECEYFPFKEDHLV
jgi:hypothetical protein